MQEAILKTLKDNFEVKQLNENSCLLDSTLFISQYDNYEEDLISVWRAKYTTIQNKWMDENWIGKINIKEDKDWVNKLIEWKNKTKEGYLHCSICGKWMKESNLNSWVRNGFIDTVCIDCYNKHKDKDDGLIEDILSNI